MRPLLALTAILAALVTGCSQASDGTPVASSEATSSGVPDEMPDDFAATVVYRNGSVPPPYHFEWQLRVDESTAELSWRPGYDEALTPWVETVPVTEEQRAELYDALRDAGAFDPVPPEDEGLAGGPTGSVELTADGRTLDQGSLGESEASQDILEDVRTAAEDLVPAEVWTRMSDKQETWGEQNPE